MSALTPVPDIRNPSGTFAILTSNDKKQSAMRLIAKLLGMVSATTKSYRQTLVAIFVVLAAGVAYAVWAGHNGAPPCPLCIFQRILFMVLALLALIGLALPTKPSRALLATMILTSMYGFGVAAYQSWMQEFPAIVTKCGYADPTLIERVVDWAGTQVPYLFLATGYCEQKDITMLGVSWAQLSAVVFLAVLLVTARLFGLAVSKAAAKE